MPELFLIFALSAGVGMFVFFVRSSVVRRHARRRLQEPLASISDPLDAVSPLAIQPPVASIFRRHYVWPWLLALAVGLGCHYVGRVCLIYVISISLIVGLLAAQVESYFDERRKAMIEQQLADALDLIISTLRAGASLVSAIERATEEARAPLKGELQNVLGLLRYGDDPRNVMRRLSQRVPLESFRLLTMTLSVHFDVGGSVAPSLAVVGRVIRDRIEIARRIRSLTAQTRISTIAMIVMTYAIAFLMWRHDPAGVRAFVSSKIGSLLVAGTMVLQAVGIVWQNAMSEVRI